MVAGYGILHSSGHIYISGCSIPLVAEDAAGKTTTNKGSRVEGLPSGRWMNACSAF